MFTTSNTTDRRYLLGIAGTLLLILALLLTSTTVWGSNRLTTQTDGESNITVLGYGDASAPADLARVTLAFGLNAPFGPDPAAFKPVDETAVTAAVNALTASGVASDTIQVDLFSSTTFYGPGNETKVSFIYAQPNQINSFFKDFLAALQKQNGPEIQNVQVSYLLNECTALEKQAWQSALLNAQERAEDAAKLLNAKVGKITSVAEQPSAYGTFSGCAALEATSKTSEYALGPLSSLNSAAEVEVVVNLQATYGLE